MDSKTECRVNEAPIMILNFDWKHIYTGGLHVLLTINSIMFPHKSYSNSFNSNLSLIKVKFNWIIHKCIQSCPRCECNLPQSCHNRQKVLKKVFNLATIRIQFFHNLPIVAGLWQVFHISINIKYLIDLF